MYDILEVQTAAIGTAYLGRVVVGQDRAVLIRNNQIDDIRLLSGLGQ